MRKQLFIAVVLLFAGVFSLFAQTRGEAYWTKGLPSNPAGPRSSFLPSQGRTGLPWSMALQETCGDFRLFRP